MANWNFEDFLQRLEALKELDSLDELVDEVPGLTAFLQAVDFQVEDLEPIERILRAMTREERMDPTLLDGDGGAARRERIAASAGVSRSEVDSLIDEFQSLCGMLEDMSPDEVRRELMEQAGPGLEPWQTAPDAWKADGVAAAGAADDADDGAMDLLRQRVDLLLAKISATGLDSLSPPERAFLDHASARFRAARR